MQFQTVSVIVCVALKYLPFSSAFTEGFEDASTIRYPIEWQYGLGQEINHSGYLTPKLQSSSCDDQLMHQSDPYGHGSFKKPCMPQKGSLSLSQENVDNYISQVLQIAEPSHHEQGNILFNKKYFTSSPYFQGFSSCSTQEELPNFDVPSGAFYMKKNNDLHHDKETSFHSNYMQIGDLLHDKETSFHNNYIQNGEKRNELESIGPSGGISKTLAGQKQDHFTQEPYRHSQRTCAQTTASPLIMEYNEPSDDLLLGSVAQGFDQKGISDIKLPLGQYFGVKSPNVFSKYPARLGIYETSDGSGLSKDNKSCFQQTSQQSLDNTHSGHEAHESLNPYCMYTPHRSGSFLKGQDKLPSSQHLNEDSSNLGDKKLPIQLKMSQSTFDYILNQPFEKKVDSNGQLAIIEKITRRNMELPEKQPMFKKLKLGTTETNSIQGKYVDPITFSPDGNLHTKEVKNERANPKIPGNDEKMLRNIKNSSKFQFLIGMRQTKVPAVTKKAGKSSTSQNKDDKGKKKSKHDPDQETNTMSPTQLNVCKQLQKLGSTEIKKIQELELNISHWFSSLKESMKASEEHISSKTKLIDKAIENAHGGATYIFLGSLIIFEHETSNTLNLHEVLHSGFKLVMELFKGWKTMKLWEWDETVPISMWDWSISPNNSKLFRYLMNVRQTVRIGLTLNEVLMSQWATFRKFSAISQKPMFDFPTLLEKTAHLLNQEQLNGKIKKTHTVKNHENVMDFEPFQEKNYEINLHTRAEGHKLLLGFGIILTEKFQGLDERLRAYFYQLRTCLENKYEIVKIGDEKYFPKKLQKYLPSLEAYKKDFMSNVQKAVKVAHSKVTLGFFGVLNLVYGNNVHMPKERFHILINNGLSFIQAIFSQWKELDFQTRGSQDVILTQEVKKRNPGWNWLDGAKLLQGLVTHKSRNEIPYTCLKALLKAWHASAMGVESSHGQALGFEIPPLPRGTINSWYLKYKVS
ncbi:hypothetical protein CROQUDRAFT_135235 [Cronartium quercuum f. sp. fusiforme G11]|uniref:Uncharacterized protein n=1 Tax=Cronartium quercuum f. sp. fusiforme G11 TaxID=708437 RepID=A0A9P6T8X3_9BASI|nr:hypothetical protein CROQUDRAFT_135235 [Cronartium quercuum f. sp. fusiforme G11]